MALLMLKQSKVKSVRIGILLLLGVSGLANAKWQRISENTIRFSGDIDNNSLSQYQTISKDGYSKLELQSFGGSNLIALKIAEDIIQRNVEIVVDGYCMSACANYLALAGKKLTVPCDSLLGWHGTVTEQSEKEIIEDFKSREYPKELVDKYLKWIKIFKDKEQNFYKKIGIDRALLTDSVKIPLNEGKKPEISFKFNEDTGEYSVSKSAVLWVPTPDVLEKYGVPTNGFCRRYSRDDIKILIEKKGFNIQFSSSGRK